MSFNIYALVMAGGKGTRFWPESTSKKPKQYHALTGKKALLTETLERFGDTVPETQRYVVTTLDQKELAQKYSESLIHQKGLIFEPSGRNTAPCIFLSLVSLIAQGISEDSVVAIVPSDHVILNQRGFQDTIKKASQFAYENHKIVTIGIPPNFPHTGFGYIQKGQAQGEEVCDVENFKEKPDRLTAEGYIKTGNYLWNAGMFVSRIDHLLKEFSLHASDIYKYKDEILSDLKANRSLKESYDKLSAISVDYAIMEKSEHVSVIPAGFDWNDLGSWDALESVVEKEDENFFVSHRAHYTKLYGKYCLCSWKVCCSSKYPRSYYYLK